MTRDPDFGPVLAVGSGGTAVEALSRVTLAVAPVDLADRACARRGGRYRGSLGDVADTLVALSRLALAYPRIESVDVNPLIVTPNGAVAVDALIVVAR